MYAGTALASKLLLFFFGIFSLLPFFPNTHTHIYILQLALPQLRHCPAVRTRLVSLMDKQQAKRVDGQRFQLATAYCIPVRPAVQYGYMGTCVLERSVRMRVRTYPLLPYWITIMHFTCSYTCFPICMCMCMSRVYYCHEVLLKTSNSLRLTFFLHFFETRRQSSRLSTNQIHLLSGSTLYCATPLMAIKSVKLETLR